MSMLDERTRARALDPDTSFIVQAPAGSGKTELLIQRYLKLLPRVDLPEAIVAITFTKKAAGEMRARVLAALRDAASGIEPQSPHQAITHALAKQALARDAAYRWELLQNPARIRVQTIDSLSASITRQMPWLSRFGAFPEITEKAAELYSEAARNTLRMVAEEEREDREGSLSVLLLHLDNDFNRAVRLISQMIEKRDQWLRRTGVTPDLAAVREAMEETLERLIERELTALRSAIPADAVRDILVLLDLDQLPDCNSLGKLDWLRLVDLVLTTNNTYRIKAPKEMRGERWVRLMDRLQLQPDTLLARLKEVRRLPPARFDDAQWQVMKALVDVLPKAVAHLNLVFRARGRVDFAELSIRALEALDHLEAPTDLALSLGYRIEHLLVDEFQDTSFTQYDLLRKLTASWEPGDGRTLFLVGDPMQSIYRFREADVSLFLMARREGIGNIQLEPLTLTSNFRSDAALVEWFNNTFAEIFPEEEDIDRGAVRYSPSIAQRPAATEAAITVHPFLAGSGKSLVDTQRTPLRASHGVGAPAPSATRGSRADEGVGPTTESDPGAFMTVRGPRPIPAGVDACPTKTAEPQPMPSATGGSLADQGVRPTTESDPGLLIPIPAGVDACPTKTAEPEPMPNATGGSLADQGVRPTDERQSARLANHVRQASWPDEDQAAEAERIVALLEDSTTTTAILVRARSHLTALVALLRRRNIAFQAIEIDQLGERPVIQDLMALTFALLHLADRISWLAVLRAPWCGLTLEDLHTIAADVAHPATIWDLLHLHAGRLTPDGQKRVARCLPVLAEAVEQRGRIGLRTLVEQTWHRLGGPACVADDSDIADAHAYFDLLETLEEAGDLPDFALLREQVEELFAQPDSKAGDRLQIMTIHKAKGLEFDRVILPGLGQRGRGDDSELLLFQEQQGELLLAPMQQTRGDSDPLYNYLKHLAHEKSKEETARLLYVAATRARRELHLLGCARWKEKDQTAAPDSDSFLKLLWPAIGHHFAALTPAVAAVSPQVKSARMIRRLPLTWTLPVAPPAIEWKRTALETAEPREVPAYEWVCDPRRHAGTVFHRFVRRVATEGIDHWPPSRLPEYRATFRAMLSSLGVPPAELDETSASVERALRNMLQDEQGRWILGQHSNAESEYEITGLLDGKLHQVQIDRTFVDEQGVRWIIDYKNSTHEGGNLENFLETERDRYRPQLERYARLMAQTEERPARLGIYFPLLRSWLEWAAPTVRRKQASLFE